MAEKKKKDKKTIEVSLLTWKVLQQIKIDNGGDGTLNDVIEELLENAGEMPTLKCEVH